MIDRDVFVSCTKLTVPTRASSTFGLPISRTPGRSSSQPISRSSSGRSQAVILAKARSTTPRSQGASSEAPATAFR